MEVGDPVLEVRLDSLSPIVKGSFINFFFQVFDNSTGSKGIKNIRPSIPRLKIPVRKGEYMRKKVKDRSLGGL